MCYMDACRDSQKIIVLDSQVLPVLWVVPGIMPEKKKFQSINQVSLQSGMGGSQANEMDASSVATNFTTSVEDNNNPGIGGCGCVRGRGCDIRHGYGRIRIRAPPPPHLDLLMLHYGQIMQDSLNESIRKSTFMHLIIAHLQRHSKMAKALPLWEIKGRVLTKASTKSILSTLRSNPR
jgi:hypothetical protein